MIHVYHAHTRVAGNEKISRRVQIIPCVGRDRAAESLAGIKQLKVLQIIIYEIVLVYYIYTGTAENPQLAVFLDDIEVVAVGEIVNLGDAVILIDIAKAAGSGNHHAVIYPGGTQDDIGAEGVFLPDGLYHLVIVDDENTGAVGTCGKLPVSREGHGKNAGIGQPLLFAHG